MLPKNFPERKRQRRHSALIRLQEASSMVCDGDRDDGYRSRMAEAVGNTMAKINGISSLRDVRSKKVRGLKHQRNA